VGGRRSKDAWQLGRGIAPAVHIWYAYKYHEDTPSWESGLAIVALTSMIASPFFLPVLFSSHEVSIASFKWQQKKRRFTTLLRIKHIRDLIHCHKEVARELQEK
jgi:hypothetical protein